MKKVRKKQETMAMHWVFTDNLRLEVNDWEKMAITPTFADKIQYLIVGMEAAPTTGHLHGQGYLKTIKGIRMKALKLLLNLPELHLEVKKGTVKEAIAYCENKDPKSECKLKDAKDIFEYGERPKGQGCRSDIQVGIDILKGGGGISEIAETAPHLIVKYPSGFTKLASVLLEKEVPLERPVKVYWLWGKTGTGKTHSAMYASDDPFVMHGYQLEKGYFDNYKGQKTLIIDEFAHQCKITYLLSLLDKWKVELNVKYASTFAKWETVFVTTNINYPDSVYPQANNEHRAALFRRITQAVFFEKPWKDATPIMWDQMADESEGESISEIRHYNDDRPNLVRHSRFIFDTESENPKHQASQP